LALWDWRRRIDTTKEKEMERETERRARRLLEMGEHSPYIDAKLPTGETVARLGLICTVYFRHGGKPAMGKRVLRCFDRFVTEFGEHLKGQFHDLSGRRFSSLRADSIAKAQNRLKKEFVDQGLGFSWDVQSEKTGETAAEYSIGTLTKHADMVDPTLSFLKLQLPWQLLREKRGEAQIFGWVRHLCDELEIEHGYAGLACNVPFDFDAYQPYEFQVTQRYSGLMVDSSAFLDLASLEDGIKGVHWLTLLGPRYVEKLGGAEVLKRRLEWPGVELEEMATGRLIIRAGVLPALGGPVAERTGHPPEYVAVNRVLKGIRVPEPDQLHTAMDDAEGYTKKNTRAWYARFDHAELPDAPEETEAPRSSPVCAAGRPCPRSGYWWTPARPKSRRKFARGEILPEVESVTHGTTIWHWDENQD
jgi:hypothetical protein